VSSAVHRPTLRISTISLENGFGIGIGFEVIQIKSTGKELLRNSLQVFTFPQGQSACTKQGIRSFWNILWRWVTKIGITPEGHRVSHRPDKPFFDAVCCFSGYLLFNDRINECLKDSGSFRGFQPPKLVIEIHHDRVILLSPGNMAGYHQ